ncbi:endonuclease/exonuclease/phosphatase family protein [Devosia sp.]|uniref:endonuclease/exonuclease/phosphatase family protein n=1 Tax=Devosia sp. TaxID=1871048 RepID=UPI0032668A9E
MVVPEFRGVLTGLSLVAVGLLAATNIDFGLAGEALLSSLQFHIGLAVLALPLLLLLTGAWRRALLMLGLIVIGLADGGYTVLQQQSLRSALAKQTPVTTVSVLSFNVLNSNVRGADAAAYIASSGADIVTVLEAVGLGDRLADLARIYPYRLGCETVAICDMTLLSKTPFTEGRVIPLPSLNRLRLITAKTMVHGQELAVVSMHLSKPYFDGIAPWEMKQVGWAIGHLKGPVVLMGDFNAAAWSHDVAQFVAEAKLMPGPGYPATWPVEAGAYGVPIDNMFTRGGALIQSIAATPQSYGSNHRGLLATVAIMPPAAP